MSKTKRAESRCRYLVREIASQKGWDTRHVQKGGDFLEEQEIEDFFPDCGLSGNKPDFLVCQKGVPVAVVEAKNKAQKISAALSEAKEYAETMNKTQKYHICLAIGVAGEEDFGYLFSTSFWDGQVWTPLTSGGFELTGFPSPAEVQRALFTNNGTTEVSVPAVSDYISVAIELSGILRAAKIEPALRPKVLGAIITALYWGEIDLLPGKELDSINSLVNGAIYSTDHFEVAKKKQLVEALKLTIGDYKRLSGKISRIVYLLKKLNVKSILQTDTDFLGLLYEAFIRYGYDNNSLGIVFTPRHITKFCANLIEVDARDRVIDIACGSGGFLVSSFDRMVSSAAQLGIPIDIVRESIYGFDTNPTVWSLAALNMFFRGDGKSHIENASCFDSTSQSSIKGRFTKALLNPPFSQEDEPERDFISLAMESLQTFGLMAVVVKSGIFADDDNALWRNSFLKKHSVLGLISLPGDLFYPTAVDTTIMIAQAHRPQQEHDRVFMAKIWNDGFRKLKGKRVETAGSELPDVQEAFALFRKGSPFHTPCATVIPASKLIESSAEFSPEKYLPQPKLPQTEEMRLREFISKSILSAAVCVEDVADEVLPLFPDLSGLPPLPYGEERNLEDFFHVKTGKSKGESNYMSGTCPYISSGDTQNSIVRLVADVDGEVFANGGITVTCFGQAYVQPWRFMARGNGGSAVRVLLPKYQMTYSELEWFAAQINMQRWRFFYGRMAILKRIRELRIAAPATRLPDSGYTISEKISVLSQQLSELMRH